MADSGTPERRQVAAEAGARLFDPVTDRARVFARDVKGLAFTGCLAALATLAALVLAACLLPPVLVRLVHGRGPLTAEQFKASGGIEGKTTEEVRALLGEPHERDVERDGSQRWYYWQDSYGIHYLGVEFGPDGRVTGTWT
jgi:outer membrane protein assembly factor BamE (lipoprotein component of BamABCDE complex)